MPIDRELLARYGIEPEYTDIWGIRHETPEAVARAILGSLGPFEDPSRPLPSTIVVRQGSDAIPIRIPADRADASVKLDIQYEGGEVEHHWLRLPELQDLEKTENHIVKRFPLPNVRLGYHRIRLYWVKEPELETFAEAGFIVCPARTYSFEGRAAGVAVSLYGLRSKRNWGCGDFTDLRAAIDAFAPAGVAFLALNPLHAIANREPYNTSPYLPQCSLYRNFIYLDVEKAGTVSVDAGVVERLRATEFIEYEAVAELKLGAMRRIFDGFAGDPDFDRYVASEGAVLDRFAVYQALDEAMHRRDPKVWLWRDWPEAYRDPGSPEVAQFAREHRRDVEFYKFLQWHVDRQLAVVQAHALEKGMRIGLDHDLALATDRFGADLWAQRRFYAAGCRVGAPPDDFSPRGQDWGFPPPDRAAHRDDGYQLFAQLIRKTARHGGALRIDHVMRFFRLWWIPDGMPAAQGAYVRDYAEDLLGILALESVREKFIVIGEDLGTVTGEVRRALDQAGILSYRVLWFERHGDGAFRMPGKYPRQAAATTTTHDLATLAGFATGRDIEARRAAALIDDQAYRQQMEARSQEAARLQQALGEAGFENDPIGFLLSTPSELAIVNQEDLTGETEQQNLPGSTWQYPNWRRKMKVAVEDLGPLAEDLGRRIARSGR